MTTSRSGKSQAAFRTISEVADELDVAQHVLRFWESKFPQVRPLKRGGGRRYYRPEDIDLIRDIRALLYDEGYTIKGAQKLLRQRRAKPAAKPAEAATQPDLPASEMPARQAVAKAKEPAANQAGANPSNGGAEPSLATAVADKTPGTAVAADRAQLKQLRDQLVALRQELQEALAAS